MSHTPTPWSDQHKFLDTNLSLLSEVDYARAQACVNACEGMQDPAAEIAALKARVAELEKLEAKYVRLITDIDLANAIKGQEMLWQMIEKPQQ